MEITVIIPSHHRPDLLARCLEHLAAQVDAPRFEVVVSIDGEEDYTATGFDRWRGGPFELQVLQNPKHSQAAALNKAVRAARGERLLILGDDTFATPTLVARHCMQHRRLHDPLVAVQGMVAWHPDLFPDPFLDWEISRGVLFAFREMPPQSFVSPKYLYTSNVSVHRALAGEVGFEESIPCSTDTVFSFRAAKRGLKLFYDPEARVHHLDRWTLERVCRRRSIKGRIARRMVAQDPSFEDYVLLPRLTPWRRMRYALSRVVRPAAERWGIEPIRGWCWSHAINHAFARGFAEDDGAPLVPTPR